MADLVLRLRVAGNQDVQQALTSLGASAQVVAKRVDDASKQQIAAASQARQSVRALGVAFSGLAAVASLFAKNNPELQRSLEVVSLSSAALGTTLRAVSAAMRVAINVIGIKIVVIAALITGIIFLIRHWDQAKVAITTAVEAIGRVVSEVFAGISQVFQGFVEILAGALTGNMDRVRAGVTQMQAGFSQIKTVMVDVTTSAIALGTKGLAFLKDQFGTVQAKADSFNDAMRNTIAIAEEVARHLKDVALDARDYEKVQRAAAQAQADFDASLEPTIANADKVAASLDGVVLEVRDGNQAFVDWKDQVDLFALDTATALSKSLTDALGAGENAFEALGNTAKRIFTQMLIDASGLQNFLTDFFGNLFGISGAGGPNPKGGGGGLFGGGSGNILNWIPFLFFQHGGIVRKPTLGIVGESGPEAVIPLNQMSARGGGGGMVFNVTFTGPVTGSIAQAREQARQVMQFIREETGRR